MADADELYAKAKKHRCTQNTRSRSRRPDRRARHFRASKRSPKRRAYDPLATFYRRYSRSFYRSFGLRICSKFYAKPVEISSENAQNFVSSELSAKLGELENEWRKFSSRRQKSKPNRPCGRHLRWRGGGVFFRRVFGVTPGAISYAATTGLLTASKRRVSRANFKQKIIENIVKKHGLSYDKDRGLELDDFFYDL